MHQSLFQLAHLPKSASPEDAAQLGCGGESLQSISDAKLLSRLRAI